MKPSDFVHQFDEASYPGNLGMMEMIKFFQIATPELKNLMKKLIAEKKNDEAWELLQKVLNVKLYEVDVDEAENRTTQAREISSVLRDNGYVRLGSGADATVWVKDNSPMVLKILMPDSQTITDAAEIFKTFVNFCVDNQDNECLPKFFPVNGEYYSFFEIKGKKYVQTYMEKLSPIPRGSYSEAIVWYFSDYAKNPLMGSKKAFYLIMKSFENEINYLTSPWQRKAKKFVEITKNLTEEQKLKLYLLFVTMRLLYQTGKVNKYYWDLHTENVMQRADGSLVITDPWFTKESTMRSL